MESSQGPDSKIPSVNSVGQSKAVRRMLTASVILIPIAVYFAIGVCNLRHDPVDHLRHMLGYLSPKEIEFLKEFYRLKSILSRAASDGIAPPPQLSGVFDMDLTSDREAEITRHNLRLFRTGRDAWGNEIQYSVRYVLPDWIEVTVQSAGFNLVDDNGQGDDFQRVIEFYYNSPVGPQENLR